MSTDPTDPAREIARAMLDSMQGTAEQIAWDEALHAIKDHADTHLPPAAAKLLRRLVTMDVAGLMPPSLRVYVRDVGVELRAAAREVPRG